MSLLSATGATHTDEEIFCFQKFQDGLEARHAIRERDIKITPEHPELDVKRLSRVIVRKNLKPVR